MTNPTDVNVGCLLVGEYTDEAEVPADCTCHRGEVVRPRVIATYLDLGSKDDGLKEFTVLLKDKARIVVHGHTLKLFPPSSPEERSHYGVVARAAGEENLVALFSGSEIVGIFSGAMRTHRDIA